MGNSFFERKELLSLLLLVFTFSGFTNSGAKYIVWGMFFVLYVVSTTPIKKLFDRNASLVLIFSMSYAVFGFLNHVIDNIPYLLFIGLSPSFFYVYGKYISWKTNNVNKLSLFFLLITIAFSSFIYWMVLTGRYFHFGSIAEERVLLDQNGEVMMAATGVGTTVSMSLIGLFVAMSIRNLRLIQRIVWVVCFVLSLYVVTFFVNRTGVNIVMIMGVVFLLFNSRKSVGRTWLSISLMAIILALILYVGVISGDIFNQYQMRGDEDVRSERWVEAMGLILSHPLGFSNVTHYNVHNMWLDIARLTGWIPFLIITLLTMRSIKSMLRLLKNNNSEIVTLLLYMFICMTLSCAVEPLLTGVPLYFLAYLILLGMINQYACIFQRLE